MDQGIDRQLIEVQVPPTFESIDSTDNESDKSKQSLAINKCFRVNLDHE